MAETTIEEMFAEFEAAARDTFRPPGVPEAQGRVRDRRRHRRGLLAGLAALLLAGSAGGYVAAHRGGPPEPRPAPTGSPSPGGKLIERKVALPGVPGRLTALRFVDGLTGWALFDTCDSNDPAARDCRRTVARTTDGGATWRRTALPAAPDGPVQLVPRDGGTLTVMTRERYLVTVDGGVTWASHLADSPPEAALRTFATPGGLRLGCPSAQGTGDVRMVTCNRLKVLRLDGSPLPHQPPVTLSHNSQSALFEGADGRLWLTVVEDDRLAVVTSDNRGRSWRRLPALGKARHLTLSPDGREVWLVRTDRPNGVWRLVGDRWQQGPALPDDTAEVAALGGGILVVVSRYGPLGFVADGRYVDVPELRDVLPTNSDQQASVATLPDGTIQVLYDETQILGTGRGTDRTWTWFS